MVVAGIPLNTELSCISIKEVRMLEDLSERGATICFCERRSTCPRVIKLGQLAELCPQCTP